MEAAKIDRLYQLYDVLSEAKDNIGEHSNEYQQLLDAVKGSTKEKLLASQFIGKFFKHFPALQDLAIDRQLDLCEDADSQIRRQAVRDLPLLCRDNKENVPKIADSLAQLLSVLEGNELAQVYASLEVLLKLDAKGVLTGVSSQIMAGDELTRERCFKYLATRFVAAGKEIITKEVEEQLIEDIKKALTDVTADEFHQCMSILGATKLGKTITGHNDLVQLATEQADLTATVSSMTYEDEIVERFIQCATHALPYFSKVIESSAFVRFICDQLLPLDVWQMMAVTDDDQANVQLRLLKVFAELCQFCGKLENVDRHIERVYNVLVLYMPQPSLDAIADEVENPSFKFSHVECLLYIVHALAKQSPTYLTFPADAGKLKDFRARLQYLARGTQGYIKKLEEAVKGKTEAELKADENQIKVTALRITSNINTLIRDLFHATPTYKAVVRLSWLTKKVENTKISGPTAGAGAATAVAAAAAATKTEAVGTKRHAPITFDKKNGNADSNNGVVANKKRPRLSNENQKMYMPPSGKFSHNVGNYANGNNSNNNNNNNNKRRFRRNGSGPGGFRGGGGGGVAGAGQKRKFFNKRR